jgi:hypothetical protein
MVSVSLVVYFDRMSPFAFNDEWAYAWSVAHFNLAHVRLMPEQAALALVQIAWAATLSLGQSDLRALRMTMAPFLIVGALGSYRCARLLGVNEFWSSASAGAVLANPLILTLATSFMSDVPYLALVLATAWAGTAWICGGRGHVAVIALTFAAVLQRQQAIAIPLAVTVGLLFARRDRLVDRNDVAALVAVWAADGFAIVLPTLAGISLPIQPSLLHLARSGVNPVHYMEPVMFALPVTALIITPFLAGLALRPPTLQEVSAPTVVPLMVGALGLLAMVYLTQHLFMPGNVWTASGFTPTSIVGRKPPGVLPLVFLAWDVLAAGTIVAVCWRRRTDWRIPEIGAGGVFLLGLALSQLLPIFALPTSFYDRYFLPVAAPLLPLAALLASRGVRQRFAMGWAVATVLFGLLTYSGFQQDYEAWQQARDRAAKMAYLLAEPSTVSAGYEANGVYDDLPMFQATGVHHTTQRDVRGPDRPSIWLAWSTQSDPRPGADYASLLAPGRIVLVSPG